MKLLARTLCSCLVIVVMAGFADAKADCMVKISKFNKTVEFNWTQTSDLSVLWIQALAHDVSVNLSNDVTIDNNLQKDAWQQTKPLKLMKQRWYKMYLQQEGCTKLKMMGTVLKVEGTPFDVCLPHRTFGLRVTSNDPVLWSTCDLTSATCPTNQNDCTSQVPFPDREDMSMFIMAIGWATLFIAFTSFSCFLRFQNRKMKDNCSKYLMDQHQPKTKLPPQEHHYYEIDDNFPRPHPLKKLLPKF
ncbi:uncharacterized protein LOC121874588 isoform X2 [Homarus americanus]|uniref:uncharacterized protein LOC121874588 isoform X2 n=1 Tax=Homarus americanus TaxID=6706 RepID=UPI001C46888D|nr:uncharacterized protein LOC121874588 isoform X2 [Homarus americanus]